MRETPGFRCARSRPNSQMPDSAQNSTRVTIVDYGSSNLLSVCRAFTECGADLAVTGSSDEIEKAERLVLPGVGAFGTAMKGVNDARVADAIRAFVSSRRPFLGICVGMQMMMDSSEELGRHDGLRLITGPVKAIPRDGSEGRRRRIPHIGWAMLEPSASGTNDAWAGTILDGLSPDDAVYFVHSFTAWPTDERHRLADTNYDGTRISAAIRFDNAYGCQFHPEKSGPVGLRIIRNFLRL